MKLCKFSRSQNLSHLVLRSCPLSLSQGTHLQCPCKRRVRPRGAGDIRVIECLFPRTWRGVEIQHPEEFRNAIIKNAAAQRSQASNEEVVIMVDKPALWPNGVKIPIVGITGEKWSGKTLWGLSIAPRDTIVFDFEDSSETYMHMGLQVKARWDLYSEMLRKHGRAATPLECYQAFREAIDKIKPGEYRVLVCDPFTDIEQGLSDWVAANPGAFGYTAKQFENAGGLFWGAVKQCQKMLLGMIAEKVECFVFTTHMGAVWGADGKPVKGARKIKGKETLFELASLYIMLERKPDAKGSVPDLPTGIIQKDRLAFAKIGEDGSATFTRILPPRIEGCTPQRIREYIQKPFDEKKPRKGELLEPKAALTEDEKLLLQSEMMENQKAVAEAQVKARELEVSRMEAIARLSRKSPEVSPTAEEGAAAVAITPGTGSAVSTTEVTGVEQPPFDTTSPAADPVTKMIRQDGQAAIDKREAANLHDEISSLFRELGLTGTQISGVLAKRGVKAVDELGKDQAEELRSALHRKVTELKKTAS